MFHPPSGKHLIELRCRFLTVRTLRAGVQRRGTAPLAGVIDKRAARFHSVKPPGHLGDHRSQRRRSFGFSLLKPAGHPTLNVRTVRNLHRSSMECLPDGGWNKFHLAYRTLRYKGPSPRGVALDRQRLAQRRFVPCSVSGLTTPSWQWVHSEAFGPSLTFYRCTPCLGEAERSDTCSCISERERIANDFD